MAEARYDWGTNGQSLDMTRPDALRFLMRQDRTREHVAAPTSLPWSARRLAIGPGCRDRFTADTAEFTGQHTYH